MNRSFRATQDLPTVVNSDDGILFKIFLYVRDNSNKIYPLLRQVRSRHWWSPDIVLTLGLIGTIAPPTAAQITPDNTLGNESSRVTPNVTIRGENGDRIDGGAARGANLFHSFSEFNVNAGQRVYFANPTGIANILSRVTGTTRSDIQGTLGVDGSANLFLLNPNGIIFGPGARLDISSSFTASTANSFTFPDGGEFSATNPGDSLLSVAVPLGAQYGATPPETITNAGNLAVGQNLSVSGGSITSTGQLAAPSGQLLVEGVAGDIQVRQAIAQTATITASNNLSLQDSQLQTAGDMSLLAGNTVQIRDSVANPFMAYAGGHLTIQGNQNVDIFALNHPSSGLVSGGNMVLRSASTVGGDAHYWTGGSFRIEQLNGNPGNLFSPYDPIIRSREDVVFDTYQGTSLYIFSGGSVRAGSIQITGIDATNNLQPISVTFSNSIATGESDPTSTITIDGRETPTVYIQAGITDPSLLTPRLTPEPFPGGTNTISPNPLPPQPASTGSSISVNNILNPGGTVLLSNYQGSNSSELGDRDITVASIDTGGGGDIYIDSQGSIIVNEAINATGSQGGGNISLLATGEIRTNNITSNLPLGGSGFGGNINLISANGSIRPSGTISSNVERDANGRSGDINLISANGSIFLDGTTVNADSIGNSDEGSGTINIVAPQGSITLNGANLRTANIGSGDAGDIVINAGNAIHVTNGSKIFAEGNLGRVYVGESLPERNLSSSTPNTVVFDQSTLSTQNVVIINDSIIPSKVDANTPINAGEIRIRATDNISILNGSLLSSDTSRNGNSGDITIEAGNALVIDGGNVSEMGRMGSIVSSQVLRGGIASENRDETSSITIKAGSLTLTRGGQINTTLNDLADPDPRNIAQAPKGRAASIDVDVKGDININAGRELAFSGIFSAVGNGNPTLEEDGRFNLRLLGLTFANGGGGEVDITSGSLSIDGSKAGVSSRTLGNGAAGDILIKTDSLRLSNGGSLDNSTTRFVSNGITNGRGDAGDITVTAADGITLDKGSINVEATRILSPSTLDSTGAESSTAGNITINTGQLTLQNGSTATVESQFGQAGSLEITANRVTLDNSTLNANAGNASGGRNNANITLTVSGPLLRLEGTRPRSLRTQTPSNALISANAIGAIDGGNITINAEKGFVLANANDNGDITANARDREDGEPSGSGGQVIINTNAIFGLERRGQETILSDITATSQSGSAGTIDLNTLNVDPTRGLGELPIDLVDTTNLVADGCVGRNRSGVTDQGEFTRTGRGGLSPSPSDLLTSETATDQLATLDFDETPSGSASISEVSQVQPLVEAQGLGINAEGKVSLTAIASTVTSPAVEQSLACSAT